MIDRRFNYGRHLIRAYLSKSRSELVVDMGAGKGIDLNAARYTPQMQIWLHLRNGHPTSNN